MIGVALQDDWTVRRSARALWLLVGLSVADPGVGQVVEAVEEVTLVEVPVEVSNAAGEPVPGLGKADFELFDRGVPQALSSVVQIDPATISEASIESLPMSSRRRLLLLFDLTFSRPASVLRARLAARDFVLDVMRPEDLAAVMIVTADSGPRMLVNFTSDRAQLARALETLGAPGLLRDHRVDDPLRLLVESPIVNPGGGLGPLTRGPLSSGRTTTADDDAQSAEVLTHLRSIGRRVEDQGKRRQRDRIAAWAETLTVLGRILGSIHGRKHVLYFSEGFDDRLVVGGQGDSIAKDAVRGSLDPGDQSQAQSERDSLQRERGEQWHQSADDNFGVATLREAMTRVIEAFQQADAVVNTIDISGLAAASDAARRGRRASLQSLALGTGGQHHGGSNAIGELLERALQSSMLTYILGFQPQALVLDGSFHELEVRLSASAGLPRGTRLSHRQGYYAPRPFQDLHPLEKKLLTADAVMTAAPRLELDMEVLVAAFRATPKAYLPVIVEIRGPSLLVGQRSETLTVEYFVYVTDLRGEMQDFLTHRAVLDLQQAHERLQASGLKFYGHLDLNPGRYRVRVLARNAETGRTSVWTSPLTIPEFGSAVPSLLPPFFIEDRETWLLVREPAVGDRVTYPFLWKSEPFVPAVLPSVLRDQSAEWVLVAYGFGEEALTVNGRVVASTEQQESSQGHLELLEVEVGRGRSLLRGRFDPLNLAPGDYQLEITVRQESGGVAATTTSRILVAE